MTFFPEPLKPSEGRKEDPLIVDPIEADKKSKKNEDWHNSPEKENPSVYGAYLSFMDTLIHNLTDTTGNVLQLHSQDDLTLIVQSLQPLLQTLQEANLSESFQFSQKFSELWYHLFESMQIYARTKSQTHINIDKLKMLITQIEHYPPDVDQKLGFYLERSVGKRWLPQPFINILHRLHSEHRTHPRSSTLQIWSELVTEILQG